MTRAREADVAAIMDEADRMALAGIRKPDGTKPDGPWVVNLMVAAWSGLPASARDAAAQRAG